jgi:hypothetical protein
VDQSRYPRAPHPDYLPERPQHPQQRDSHSSTSSFPPSRSCCLISSQIMKHLVDNNPEGCEVLWYEFFCAVAKCSLFLSLALFRSMSHVSAARACTRISIAPSCMVPRTAATFRSSILR